MSMFHLNCMNRVFHSGAVSDTIEASGGMDMQIRLAENIRALRRQHRFTQEQLAESLGVTPGAVYKWETGLSQPELAIIVELSDLFDTSVDVLLGYEMKDNRRQTTADRLRRYQTEKDRTGLAEAEKALQKYPNDFEIVESDRNVAHAAADRRGLRPTGRAAAGAAGMDHRRVYPAVRRADAAEIRVRAALHRKGYAAV